MDGTQFFIAFRRKNRHIHTIKRRGPPVRQIISRGIIFLFFSMFARTKSFQWKMIFSGVRRRTRWKRWSTPAWSPSWSRSSTTCCPTRPRTRSYAVSLEYSRSHLPVHESEWILNTLINIYLLSFVLVFVHWIWSWVSLSVRVFLCFSYIDSSCWTPEAFSNPSVVTRLPPLQASNQ